MDHVPQSQPKPWRDGLVEDAIDVDELEDGNSGSSSGEPEEREVEWRDGHNRAWGAARRVGFKQPRAAKRPRQLPASPVSEEQDPELDAGVAATSTKIDLGLYFGTVPHAKQIAICRAYASYLSAKRRASSSEK